MGLLEKLWDDTVAGPQPDSGLGRLRKFSPRSNPSKDIAYAGEGIASADNQEEVKISRKIMIIKPPGYNYQGTASAPASPALASPADSTPPSSPFSGGRSRAFRFRRKCTDANEKAEGEDRAFRNSPPSQDV